VAALLAAAGPDARIVEVGAGSLRNALFLQGLGYRMTVLELAGTRARFKASYERFERQGGEVFETPQGQRLKFPIWDQHFDFAIATFVLETVCIPKVRLALLRRCRRMLKESGWMILAVRGVADVVTATASGRPCSDGYVTPHRTFIRSYTRAQLAALVRRAGFGAIQFLHGPKTLHPEYLYALARRSR
jgi:ubiquinone/menaquinone biosynthesis C-methylase UbiE